ncbi:DUF3305 domain-containing protein [Pikeienuella piscinae]|uniref:DUF3305 domain-containing protein n=2 Tax=Pikeienuella piscinae TaxID=2748098 RepID=A0A7M3T739_9RHOB|nr:DUF3305 domain-containing protein [Pikeienuella piscinae]
MPVGVILRRSPGVTRWAKFSWRVIGVLPGAGPADWRELRREAVENGEAVDFHAGTLTLTLHRTDTEAYLVALSAEPPVVFVVLRKPGGADDRLELSAITASAFEAQDYADSGEELVEPVPAPPGLVAWISDFVARHHRDETFVKRQRKRWAEREAVEGGADPRVRSASNVFRAPTARKTEPR